MSSTYQDYMIYMLKRLVDQGGIRGIYADNTIFFPCTNPSHGHGFTNAEGQLQGDYDIRAEHEFRKRLYTMLTSKWAAT